MSTPELERLPRGLKRLSLAAGPRPLRLATSSSTSPPITQSSPAPNPNTNGDPITHSHGRRMSSKRMSSISYYTPNSPSPMTSPALRSAPLIPEWDRLDKGKQRDLSNSNGLQRSASYASRRAAMRADQDEDVDTRPKPPPVLTLAEKHADLLHFIAQKESKCLELRDQLSHHEEELSTLKRKWERIVARSSAPLADSRGPTASEGVGEVVGAIRDGVQGLGRMLVMGGLPNLAPADKDSNVITGKVIGHDYDDAASSSSNGNSRSSSLSSLPATAISRTTSTARSSLSSATSFEDDDVSRPKSLDSSEGGHTPTLATSKPPSPIRRNGDHLRSSSVILTPVSVTRRRSIGKKIKAPVFHDEVTSTPSPMSLREIGSPRGSLDFELDTPREEDEEEDMTIGIGARAFRDVANDGRKGSWVPGSLNKRWSELQKTDTFTKSSKRASVLISDMTSASTTLIGSLSSALTPSSSSFPSSPTLQPPLAPTRPSITTTTTSSSKPKPFTMPSRNGAGYSNSNSYFPAVDLDSLSFGGSGSGMTSPSLMSKSPSNTSLLDDWEGQGELGAVMVPSTPSAGKVAPGKGEADETRFESDDDWNW